MLARHFLPYRFALMFPKLNRPSFCRGREKNTPAIVGHFDVIEVRPTARIDADCSAQIDLELLRTLGSHLAPPLQIVGQPVLERALQRLVIRQVDVVRNLVVVADAIHDEYPTANWARLARRTKATAPDIAIDLSHATPIELGLDTLAVYLERAFFSDCIGANENPILPCRQPPEDPCLDRLV